MARINDITAYPTVVPVDADIVIGSDGGSGGATKNFKMSDIKTYVDSSSITLTTSGTDGASTLVDKALNIPIYSGEVTSANPAITVATGTTTPVLTSNAYTGGNNIGHVPTGGDSLKYLKGDGTWATPLVTSSIVYSQSIATQSVASGSNAGNILFGNTTTYTDVTINANGEIRFDNTGLYIVEFFGNFKLVDPSTSQVVFQPFLDGVEVRNIVVVDLPGTPDIYIPFTRTDVFQVESGQVLNYEAGHVSGTNAELIALQVQNIGNINGHVPSASVTVSRIKI